MEPQSTSACLSAETGHAQEIPPRSLMEESATLQQVFAREESPLLRYAYGLVGQRETAEDLVQEVFMRLHTHWHEVTNPRAWLFRAVHNLALNHLRDHKRESPIDPNHDLPADNPEPDQALGRLEAIGTLQLLLSELPPEDRDLIQLKYHHNLKYDQISQSTGLTIGNVGYKLHHLLKNLADSLRRQGIESPEG